MFNADESFSSEGEKEDTLTDTCHPNFRAEGKESCVSYRAKRHERIYLEGAGGLTPYEESSSAREGLQRKMFMDSDEKSRISCLCGKTMGNVTVHQCNNTACEMNPSISRNTKSRQRTAVDDGDAQDQSVDIKQSTSLLTEADPNETKQPALCQTVC